MRRALLLGGRRRLRRLDGATGRRHSKPWRRSVQTSVSLRGLGEAGKEHLRLSKRPRGGPDRPLVDRGLPAPRLSADPARAARRRARPAARAARDAVGQKGARAGTRGPRWRSGGAQARGCYHGAGLRQTTGDDLRAARRRPVHHGARRVRAPGELRRVRGRRVDPQLPRQPGVADRHSDDHRATSRCDPASRPTARTPSCC